MSACIMIMAGGTGGHVFPALAVANELRARGAEVFWLGTRNGLEAKVVPEAGIDIEWISISGLRGKGVIGWLLAPFRLAKAIAQSIEVIFRRRPMAVLGMGGFVSGPGGLVTWLLRKPLLIHEQNAIAGLTNKLLAKRANKVMEAFPGTFKGLKTVISLGNPVRKEIAELPEPAERFAGREGKLRVLVIGGSLGAQALNETVPQAIAQIDEAQRPEVFHQAGQRNIEAAREQYDACAVEAKVEPFIADMAEAYAWADVVICRSGALTVCELAAAGVGAVLVPFPFAVDDHQTANGRYLAGAGAAELVQQSALTAEKLSEILQGFVVDCQSGRERLLAMANKARALAKPESTRQVADLCLEATSE